MKLFEAIFPPRIPMPEIDRAPPGAQWHGIRPSASAKSVKAHLADKDGEITNERGVLRYKRDRDYLVEHAPGNAAVVDRETFKRTYRLRGDGSFQKRTDVTYRYFQLPHAVMVRTAEGPQRAEPNDWIVEGLHGEIWPVRENIALTLYEIT